MSANQVTLRLLLSNGKAHEFTFDPTASIADVKSDVFEHWPEEWKPEAVATVGALRLLLRGKFLEDSSTLSGLGIPTGQTTTVHLVPKATGTDAGEAGNSASKSNSNNDVSGSCCTIL